LASLIKEPIVPSKERLAGLDPVAGDNVDPGDDPTRRSAA